MKGCEKCNYRGYSIIDGQVISCEHCRCPDAGKMDSCLPCIHTVNTCPYPDDFK